MRSYRYLQPAISRWLPSPTLVLLLTAFLVGGTAAKAQTPLHSPAGREASPGGVALAGVQQAFETAADKRSGAIKVAVLP